MLNLASRLFGGVVQDLRHWSWPQRHGMATDAGVPVTPETAMRFTAVFAAHSILSGGVAQLPRHVIRHNADGTKERDDSHPLSDLISIAPNPYEDAHQFFEGMTFNFAAYGNAYAEKIPGPRGPVDQLVTIHPNTVLRIERLPDRTRRYWVRRENGDIEPLLSRQMFHLKDVSLDGICGISRLSLARQGIGLALAAESHGARQFGQGARPALAVTHPAGVKPGKDGWGRLTEAWEEAYGGPYNTGTKTVFLWDGAEVKQISLSNVDAQFLETRQFQIADIARLYNIPLHMLQQHEKSTSWGTGVEQLTLGFVVFSLGRWLRSWESAMRMQLVIPEARRRYTVEHNVDGFVRGDIEKRSKAYSIAIQNGWLSPNEVRKKENLNPRPGGDEYLTPKNMSTSGDADGDEAGDRDPEDDASALIPGNGAGQVHAEAA